MEQKYKWSTLETNALIEAKTEFQYSFEAKGGNLAEAWCLIQEKADLSHIPLYKIKYKWKNLTKKYRALRRSDKHLDDGVSKDECNWKYFDAMHKLIKQKRIVKPWSPTIHELPQTSSKGYSPERCSPYANQLNRPKSRISDIDEESNISINEIPESHKSKKSYNCLQDNQLIKIHPLLNNTDNREEFQLFGDSVAIQLSKLPIVIAIQLQAEIQNHLSRARLKALDNVPLTNECWCNLDFVKDDPLNNQ